MQSVFIKQQLNFLPLGPPLPLYYLICLIERGVKDDGYQKADGTCSSRFLLFCFTALALKPSNVNGGIEKLLSNCDTVNLPIPSDPYLLVPVPLKKSFLIIIKKKNPACHRRKDTSSETLVRGEPSSGHHAKCDTVM